MWKLKLLLFIFVLAQYGISGLFDKNKVLWDYTASPEDVRNNHIELMKLYMNISVDPCDDFYEYSCGNWKNANELHSEIQNVRDVLYEKIQQVVTEFMEESSDDGNNNEEAFKLFYKSCMNTAAISKRGKHPVIDFLKTLDGWPMVDSKSSDVYVDWLKLSAELASYDKPYVLRAYTDSYFDDTIQDHDAIHIKLSYPKLVYFLDESKNITNFIMGDALSDTVLDEITVFIESFRKIYSKGRFENVYPITLEELIITDPHIDWERYLSILLQKHINSTQKVIAPVNTLEEIGNLLSNTSSRIITNYILYTAMVDMVKEFIYVNATTYETRKEYCKTFTGRYFSRNLSKTFVDKYLDESAKDRAIKLIEEIREASSEFIGNIFLIDAQTKQIAQQNVNSIQLKVGYTDKDFENYFDYPDLKLEEYFENSMKLRKHEIKTIWSKKPAETRERLYIFSQYDMVAYYIKEENTAGYVYVTAAMLQPPLFNKYNPNWSNYGGIGYTIGHEITRGFNESFMKSPENETNSKWWSPESFKDYMNRTLCNKFENDKYKFEDLKISVDGQSMLSEYIADNGGLKFGYEAYKKWLNNNKDSDENQVNSVLNLSGEQLYFVSFAQTLCNAETKKEFEERLTFVRHPPLTFRVIGSVTNSFDFAKVFQCPIGSPMNPLRKCRF